MGGSTTNFGFPYPYSDETISSNDLKNLALAVDAGITNWKSSIQTLETEPTVQVRSSAGTSVPANTTTNLTYDTVVNDPNGIVNLGTDNQNIHVPAGVYWVQGSAGIFSAFNDIAFRLSIIRNGTGIIRNRIFLPNSNPSDIRVSGYVNMDVAGTIRLTALINNSGGPFTTKGYLSLTKLRGPF